MGLLTVFVIYEVCYSLSLILVRRTYNGVGMMAVRSLSWSLVRAGVVLVFVYAGYRLKNYILAFLTYCRQHLWVAVLIGLASAPAIIPFITFETVDYHLLKTGIRNGHSLSKISCNRENSRRFGDTFSVRGGVVGSIFISQLSK